jgi:hypothetical protein
MNDSEAGCAVVLVFLLAAPFFIAAIPILAGVVVGLIFAFVIVPAAVWFILNLLGLK